MSAEIKRLLIFFFSVPTILMLVYAAPHAHFLAFHLVIFGSVMGAVWEMHAMVSRRMCTYPLVLLIPFSLVLPLLGYAALWQPARGAESVLFIGALGTLLMSVFFTELVYSFSASFENALERMASALLLVLYPGIFSLFFSLITRWRHAEIALVIFFLMVFTCDSCAWFCGTLWGVNNRGIIPASPKKSIAGFIGGFAGSVGAGCFGSLVFGSRVTLSLGMLMGVGALVGLTAIVGDLVESVMKRSAQVKDSGFFTPGRGGIMDNLDSLAPSLGTFYIACECFGIAAV
ncbi:phosphatidate cytidylyltransferase [Treponema pallidum subsp. pallidum str. Sea 81-4]|uniref:phosphatidate cytidylyltransferase n=1 Tax=Treponema pallidum TaxID=160 RepID=UPI0004375DDA|nr:phosphatidate cytidylyltransferase [Treponema pallidum]AHN67271.1 phosphatidate cytidylyltransferase [Treponema pallidum subsp. pallidum str. Sea 81-4]